MDEHSLHELEQLFGDSEEIICITDDKLALRWAAGQNAQRLVCQLQQSVPGTRSAPYPLIPSDGVVYLLDSSPAMICRMIPLHMKEGGKHYLLRFCPVAPGDIPRAAGARALLLSHADLMRTTANSILNAEDELAQQAPSAVSAHRAIHHACAALLRESIFCREMNWYTSMTTELSAQIEPQNLSSVLTSFVKVVTRLSEGFLDVSCADIPVCLCAAVDTDRLVCALLVLLIVTQKGDPAFTQLHMQVQQDADEILLTMRFHDAETRPARAEELLPLTENCQAFPCELVLLHFSEVFGAVCDTGCSDGVRIASMRLPAGEMPVQKPEGALISQFAVRAGTYELESRPLWAAMLSTIMPLQAL